ncbi:MAG: DUF2997 domain-containing protein [Armatimonadetes bacterium]|nr:DUF2997 domain-containing protein [Armatimonadota bacterium]
MGKQRIEFIIRPDGSVEERPQGFTGEACEEVTRRLEQTLGVITHREPTAERYQNADDQDQTIDHRQA